jgi:predicted homoserine dehydrogenase-like protein
LSTVMRHKLSESEETGERIKVGVIGAGVLSCLTIGQVSRLPDITTSTIADIYTDKAIRAFKIPPSRFEAHSPE